MKKVTLTIIDDNRKSKAVTTLPESWQELSLPAFWAICVTLMTKPIEHAKFEAMRFYIEPKYFRLLDASQLAWVGTLLDFLGTVPNQINTIFPKYRGLIAPTSFLEKATVNEYAACDTAFRSFIKTKDEKYLITLTAIIYRKPRKNYKSLRKDASFKGDLREPFNSSFLPTNAEKVAKMPRQFRFVAMALFVACKQFLVEKFKDLFPKSEGNGKGKEASWADMKTTLAELQIFGTLDEVGERSILGAFYYLNKKIQEQNEKS